MGCTNCSYDSNGTPKGCGDKGHCSSGSCNKRNTYDWINTLELDDPMEFNMVEVSFKKGSRKEFFIKKSIFFLYLYYRWYPLFCSLYQASDS